MADPQAQADTQLRNIEEKSGMRVEEFVDAVEERGFEKHGQILAFLKTEHGLTHGNANLLAHRIRELLAGGPPSDEHLLAAQYDGGRAALRPIYDALAALASGMGDDVVQVIQKTGVSFRRAKQFALVQAPSSKRVQLGLNLDETPGDSRIVEMSGMCTHKVDLAHTDEIDDDIARWIQSAYERAG